MSNLTYLLILAAAYVAWQVISHLYENAKRKELEQQRGQTQVGRRRPAVGSSPSRAATLRQRGSSATPGAGWDDLAARRRAQLEQLRARRSTTRTGPTLATTARPGPPTPTATPIPRRPVTRPQVRTAPPVDPGDWFRQQQAKPTPPRRAPVALRPERVVRRRPPRAPTVSRVIEEEPPEGIAAEPEEHRERAGGPRPAGTRAQRVLGRLQDAGSLQDLFVLKEVLDPPVGLRSPGTGGSP